MSTNAYVLVTVASLATLVLVGAAAVLTLKTRHHRIRAIADAPANEDEQAALNTSQQEARAVACAAKAHVAQVEVDIKSAEARRLHREAADQEHTAQACRDEQDLQSRTGS